MLSPLVDYTLDHMVCWVVVIQEQDIPFNLCSENNIKKIDVCCCNSMMVTGQNLQLLDTVSSSVQSCAMRIRDNEKH